jgi:hypothetical protein
MAFPNDRVERAQQESNPRGLTGRRMHNNQNYYVGHRVTISI